MEFKEILTDHGRERLKIIARTMVEIEYERLKRHREVLALNEEARSLLPEQRDYHTWHNSVHNRVLAIAESFSDD